jgi:hypothetical protein
MKSDEQFGKMAMAMRGRNGNGRRYENGGPFFVYKVEALVSSVFR